MQARLIAPATATLVALGLATAPAPAQAAPAAPIHCSTVVRTSARHTYLSIVGGPANANRVYSFRLQAGLPKSHTYTYVPTYRTYTINKRFWGIHQAEGWMLGQKCRTWQGGNVF